MYLKFAVRSNFFFAYEHDQILVLTCKRVRDIYLSSVRMTRVINVDYLHKLIKVAH